MTSSDSQTQEAIPSELLNTICKHLGDSEALGTLASVLTTSWLGYNAAAPHLYKTLVLSRNTNNKVFYPFTMSKYVGFSGNRSGVDGREDKRGRRPWLPGEKRKRLLFGFVKTIVVDSPLPTRDQCNNWPVSEAVFGYLPEQRYPDNSATYPEYRFFKNVKHLQFTYAADRELQSQWPVHGMIHYLRAETNFTHVCMGGSYGPSGPVQRLIDTTRFGRPLRPEDPLLFDVPIDQQYLWVSELGKIDTLIVHEVERNAMVLRPFNVTGRIRQFLTRDYTWRYRKAVPTCQRRTLCQPCTCRVCYIDDDWVWGILANKWKMHPSTRDAVVELVGVGSHLELECNCVAGYTGYIRRLKASVRNAVGDRVNYSLPHRHAFSRCVRTGVEMPHWSEVEPCACCGTGVAPGRDDLQYTDDTWTDPQHCPVDHEWTSPVSASDSQFPRGKADAMQVYSSDGEYLSDSDFQSSDEWYTSDDSDPRPDDDDEMPWWW